MCLYAFVSSVLCVVCCASLTSINSGDISFLSIASRIAGNWFSMISMVAAAAVEPLGTE